MSRPGPAGPLPLCFRVAALLIGRWGGGPDRVGWNDRGRLCWATPGSLPVAILSGCRVFHPTNIVTVGTGAFQIFPRLVSSTSNFFSLLSPVTSHLRSRVSELAASGHAVCTRHVNHDDIMAPRVDRLFSPRPSTWQVLASAILASAETTSLADLGLKQFRRGCRSVSQSTD